MFLSRYALGHNESLNILHRVYDWGRNAPNLFTYGKKGQHDKAILEFTKAIEIDPTWAEPYVYRGIVYLEAKYQYDKAIADFNKALDIDPRHADAYFNRGLAYDSQEEYEKAISDYSKVIEINPDRADAYLNRGVSYADLWQHKQAIADYNKAIMINPEDWSGYLNRATEYRILGENEKACSDLKRVCELGTCDFFLIWPKKMVYANKRPIYGGCGSDTVWITYISNILAKLTGFQKL